MLAHCLTGLRLLLVLPAALVFAAMQAFPSWLPLALMLTAIATDIADGKVARARGTASPAGQLFDHATDCLFVTSALAGAAYAGFLTPWLAPLILFAFAQYVLDSYFLHRRKQLRMSLIGRWNGILYYIPPLLLALFQVVREPVRNLGVPALTPEWQLLALAAGSAWVLVVSTLVSIIDRALARSAGVESS